MTGVKHARGINAKNVKPCPLFGALCVYMVERLTKNNTKKMKKLMMLMAALTFTMVMNAQDAAKIAEGQDAPEFTLPGLDGKTLKLSDLRGKYVVLDFWGSWCANCIKGFPEMAVYYEKYKDKMEILGVDCNDTEARWKAAVEKHKMPWKQIRQSKEGDQVTVMYGVKAFPTKVIINPEGKIAKVVVGEDPAFYTILDELLAQ